MCCFVLCAILWCELSAYLVDCIVQRCELSSCLVDCVVQRCELSACLVDCVVFAQHSPQVESESAFSWLIDNVL
jgi:hypothetical protein